MKKLLIASCLMLGFAMVTSAQQAKTKPADSKMTAVKPTATTTSAKVVKMDKAEAPAKAKANGLKADGTPDMRLKANKAGKAKTAPSGPTKADGTPDMRFKSNKNAKAPAKAKGTK